jgi:PAS domain S-box-containing protein
MHAALTSRGADARSANQPGGSRDAATPRQRARLQSVAIAVIAACVIGALWLIISVVVETERDAAIGHARSETNNLSAAFQAEVEGKLDSVVRSMDFIANRVRTDGQFDVYAWAREHRPLTENVMQAVSLIGPNGMLLSTSRDAHAPALDLSDRDYFRVHLDGRFHGTYVSPLVVGRLSNQPGIVISRRVEADDGRFLGVIIVSLAPGQLTVLHKKANIGPRDVLSLIGFDGVIRARFGAGSENGELGAGQRVPLPPAIGNGTPAQSYIRTAVLDHVTRLFSNRSLDRFPLYVSVGFDMDAVLWPSAAHARLIEVIGVFATIMLGGLALLLIVEVRRGAEREMKLAEDQARLDAEVRHGQEIQERLRSSEQRLRDFAVMASDWLWEQDADLRFTEIGIEAPNPSRDGRYIGKRRWEMQETSLAPEYWANHQREVMSHKAFRDFRYSIVSPDGTTNHVSVTGIPVYDGAGRFAGYRGTGRNITKEVVAEVELRDAKNRAEQAETLLRDAVDSIAEGFVIYDSEDRLMLCNDAYRRMYPQSAPLMVPGVTYETLVRNSLAAGCYPEAVGREEEWLAGFMRAHRDADREIETEVSKDKWLLVTDRRMRNGGIAGLRVDITALKQAKVALRESEARLERAQAIAGIGSWELDIAAGRYVWSKELYRIRGVSPEAFDPNIDNVEPLVHPDDYPGIRRWLTDLIAGLELDTRETRIVRPDGELRLLRVEGRAVRDPDGVIYRLAGTMQDITERRLIERQLSQAQKMEAIGNLTGGMAHDFNNGLGVIIGNLDLLGRMVKDNGTAAEVCDEARDAAVRCADLIRGLLAFARRQPLQPRQTDVNALVKDTARLLGRTLGEDIALNLTLGATLWPALADAAQLEAALVNLATNARDAMPKGGQLRIATRNAQLDAEYAALHPDATPGDYVLIEVTDTGTGIAPEIVGHIFEPFFTTKETGKGSGLGLAMVFGFVKQSGGNLDLYSEPELGTTFRLYLPRAQASDAPATIAADRRPAVGGDETILLVEDNARLRQVAARQLSELGYRVLEAENAEQALRVVSSAERIDLLFSDVVMPGAIDGVELARLVERLRPRPGILLASGFPAGRIPGQPPRPPGFPLLGKPYDRDELAHAVRDALSERRDDETLDRRPRYEPETSLGGTSLGETSPGDASPGGNTGGRLAAPPVTRETV